MSYGRQLMKHRLAQHIITLAKSVVYDYYKITNRSKYRGRKELENNIYHMQKIRACETFPFT
jgi:hypothetical protein